ncbi:hypothetical protein ACH419_36565 [Streptomyces bobili]|uniref:hypothetical protein n=1 Tax=Streptomyces bobili TaxID=67280 RepID=UPI00379A2517
MTTETTPYSYIDPQNHRMQFLAVTRPRGPYVSCEAEKLTVGGDSVAVSLPAAWTRVLADHLDRLAFYEFIDGSGAMLRVEPAHPWTRFTFAHDAREDDAREDDEPSAAVSVIVLTGRLPEVARALNAGAERAESEQRTTEHQAQSAAAAAAARFAAVWSDEDTAEVVAPVLQCVELDALVALLHAAGATAPTLDYWVDAYTDDDPHCGGHSTPPSEMPPTS